MVHVFLLEALQSRRQHIHLKTIFFSFEVFHFLSWICQIFSLVSFLFQVMFFFLIMSKLFYNLEFVKSLHWPEFSLTVPLPSERLRKVTWCWNMECGLCKEKPNGAGIWNIEYGIWNIVYCKEKPNGAGIHFWPAHTCAIQKCFLEPYRCQCQTNGFFKSAWNCQGLSPLLADHKGSC